MQRILPRQQRFARLAGQGPHDAAQAENIRIAAEAHPYDRILVLVGNIHARKRPIERGEWSFEPMVMHLGPSASIVTLNMVTAGGTSWNCELKPDATSESGKPMTSDAIDECGSHPFAGQPDLRRPPFIALPALPGVASDPAYDGVFWLGKVSASPPAVPDNDGSPDQRR